jgi:hypothetical protein
VAFLEPPDIVEDGGGARLDAAVVAIDRGVWLILASAKPRACCSATNRSTSSCSEP